jgi:adenylate cyclase
MAVAELPIPLDRLARCFQAVIPGNLATVSKDGVPHLIGVSHVHLVDDHHIAISRQFQKKTLTNLAENPRATVGVMDPPTLDCYRLGLRFEREETSGPVFDEMTTRLAAVASMTGMVGVFRLQSAMIFEVLSIEQVPGILEPGEAVVPPPSPLGAIDDRTQLRVLRQISEAVSTSANAEVLLDSVLGILDAGLEFQHSMILLYDEANGRLDAITSRGYPESGVGAEVRLGEGIIGTVAEKRRLLRMTGLDRARRYARAVRSTSDAPASKEIPLPGLADAESQMALPLVVKNELLGVLFVESRRQLAYAEHDEAFLEVVASHVALGLQSLMRAEDPEPASAPAPAAPSAIASGPVRLIQFYPADDCIFVDGQYLIRNIPGRILWTLLRARIDEGRTEFSNRELRLDTSLGLPPFRDNLESRLILLRKRLALKCPDLRMVSTGRGRFALDVRCRLELQLKS